MQFDKATIRILVRKDYGACYDFYTQKMGLVPVWGDKESEYTSFAVKEGEPPCFAIFMGANMSVMQGYAQPAANTQPDTIVGVIPSQDLEADYKRLSAAGVEFTGPPQHVEGWGMTCTYFRDPEGNLFELNDASGV